MKINIVNPSEREFTKHRYILWFGAYASTHCLVWANNLDDALDECVDWLAENAPGLLADEEVQAEYKREYEAAIAEGLGEEEACERAIEVSEVDTTHAGSAGHYLHSWEWGITAENPTRKEIKKLQAA